MVSALNLQALRALCDGRDAVLGSIEAHYGLTGSPALGETARGVAKGLPIRLLHGGSHAAWLAAHGLAEEHPMLPLMVQLERELRGCRREVYRYMGRHDAAWLAKVEAHVREAKAGEALRRHGPGGGRARAAAAAAAREVWLLEKVEASVFARVLQDIEDRCLNCVRMVLQGEGWPARSWQQDGLLVEDMGGRQLRGGGGGGEPAVVRLEAAMRKAEAEVLAREKLEVGLLVKTFFDGPVEAVLQRMAGPGGRRPAAAEARGAAARARAAGAAGGGRAPPPPRTPTAVAGAAAAEVRATRAERAAAALAAEREGLARERRDVMRRQRQVRLDDAMVAAADETAMDETEAGEAGTAGAAGGRDSATGARKRSRGEGEGEDDGGEGTDDAVVARLTAGDDDGVRATGDEACDNDRGAATGSGDVGDDGGGDNDGDGDEGETRGGDDGDGGGEASGGSVATTGEGEASGGGGDDDGEGDGDGDGGAAGPPPPHKKQRRAKGRKTNGARVTARRAAGHHV